MSRTTTRIALLALPALVAALGGCSALANSKLVTLGVEYWDAQPGGSVSAGNLGDAVDVDSALDLDKERVWVYHAAASVGPTRLEASYIDIGFNGFSTLANGFDFGGQTFIPGDDVNSDLDTSVIQIHTVTGAFNWNVVSLGVVAGLDQLSIETEVSNGTVTGKQEYDEWVPVVGLAAGARVPLWKIAVFADGKVSGIFESISFGTLDGDYLSGVIRGGVDIDDGFKVGIGYRSLEADFEDGSDEFDLDLGGGFLFLELNF